MSEVIFGLVFMVLGALSGAAYTAHTIGNDCIHVGKWRTGSMVFECRPVEKAK